uniref:Uncharacterized protein n=1 Tax=Lepeophtheirus salmonis TaxID=72036 RepID=A0A0K2VIY7_LEPSM
MIPRYSKISAKTIWTCFGRRKCGLLAPRIETPWTTMCVVLERESPINVPIILLTPYGVPLSRQWLIWTRSSSSRLVSRWRLRLKLKVVGLSD